MTNMMYLLARDHVPPVQPLTVTLSAQYLAFQFSRCESRRDTRHVHRLTAEVSKVIMQRPRRYNLRRSCHLANPCRKCPNLEHARSCNLAFSQGYQLRCVCARSSYDAASHSRATSSITRRRASPYFSDACQESRASSSSIVSSGALDSPPTKSWTLTFKTVPRRRIFKSGMVETRCGERTTSSIWRGVMPARKQSFAISVASGERQTSLHALNSSVCNGSQT